MTENKELISAKDIQQLADSKPSNSFKQQAIDRRAFLQLPVAQRNALLTQQAASVAEYFLPGAEAMEWTDEYLDEDNWDDE